MHTAAYRGRLRIFHVFMNAVDAFMGCGFPFDLAHAVTCMLPTDVAH